MKTFKILLSIDSRRRCIGRKTYCQNQKQTVVQNSKNGEKLKSKSCQTYTEKINWKKHVVHVFPGWCSFFGIKLSNMYRQECLCLQLCLTVSHKQHDFWLQHLSISDLKISFKKRGNDYLSMWNKHSVTSCSTHPF